MKIALGCDHAAVEMKDAMLALIAEMGLEAIDMGTTGSTSVDYPDFAQKVCRAVLDGKADRGILVCGTGIGMSIAANKFPGIRAALCSESYSARMSRMHNNANVLCMGARTLGRDIARDVARTWIETEFEGGRHALRLNKITTIEGDRK